VPKQEQESLLTFVNIIRSLYLGILGRDADQEGLKTYCNAVKQGKPLSEVVKEMLSSPEYRASHQRSLNVSVDLPDLTELYADKYVRRDGQSAIFKASSDRDFRFMENLIARHRYYDNLGVWAPAIDADKRVTASIVRGFGARSCLELGCFSGAVLTQLVDQGIDVCGVEISHLAFVLAYQNIHGRLRFGNLLEMDFQRQFDIFLGMDVLEHLNPLDLGRYVERIAQLVQPKGFVYINSPMFGMDSVFGTVFEAYLPEWREAGEGAFWNHMHCDAKGWPVHGHLVWASPSWWERIFFEHGLVRDKVIEKCIHMTLKSFFDKAAPARRSFFVLRHAEFVPDHQAVCANMTQIVSLALASPT
jgi:SAM-dependent methyltransferase